MQVSVEVFPPKYDVAFNESFKQEIKDILSLEIDMISVTHGAMNTDRTNLDVIEMIREISDIRIMAHLTGYDKTEEEVLQFCDALIKLNVNEILCLRGDGADNYEGPQRFPHSSDLIKFIRGYYNDAFILSAACYPEGHIESPNKRHDLVNTIKKVEAGASRLYTQIFFDQNDYYELKKELNNYSNVELVPGFMPLRPGINLKKIALLSGVRLRTYLLDAFDKVKKDRSVYGSVLEAFSMKQAYELAMSKDLKSVHIYIMNKRSVGEKYIKLFRDMSLFNKNDKD